MAKLPKWQVVERLKAGWKVIIRNGKVLLAWTLQEK